MVWADHIVEEFLIFFMENRPYKNKFVSKDGRPLLFKLPVLVINFSFQRFLPTSSPDKKRSKFDYEAGEQNVGEKEKGRNFLCILH